MTKDRARIIIVWGMAAATLFSAVSAAGLCKHYTPKSLNHVVKELNHLHHK